MPALSTATVVGVVLITAVLVGIDATQRGLGAVGNALGVALIWVIAFPAYLNVRAKHGAKNLVGLGVLGVLALLGGVFGGALVKGPDLPTCDAPEVTQVAKSALESTPAWKAAGLTGTITNPGEVRFRPDPPRRVCRAQLTTKVGVEVVFYFVEWQNKDKGQMWVQIIGNQDDGR